MENSLWTKFKVEGLGILIACVSILVYGCGNNRHAVIAVTGTNIGLDISQNPANQTPQAKLGYQRSEVAIVPSNRSGGVDPAGTNTYGTGTVGGASDVADVVMELKFSNIFSGIFNPGSGGIYQRLAVGETAVEQLGAAFMFARDQKGGIGSSTASEIAKSFKFKP